MSFVIDENAIQRFLEENSSTPYTVTVSNVGSSIEDSPPPLLNSGVSSTVSATLPNMSSETIGRLLDLRQQIVASGAHLMTTEELDNEVAERKGRLAGD
jgi:hypothetical protein